MDALFSELNLAIRDDYTRFLESNFIALSALGRQKFTSKVDEHIVVSTELLRADLAVLKFQRSPVPEIATNLDSVGVQYVLAGANFGKRVLKGRWSKSRDHLVLAAGSYLNSNSNRELWSDFMSLTEQTVPDEKRELIIVQGASQVFDLFAECFLMTERRIV